MSHRRESDDARPQLRLSQLSHGTGCGRKLAFGELTRLLEPVAAADGDTNGLLSRIIAGDDAAVYRMDDDRAIVASVDFVPPLVDDPFDFGRIAAAHALSDCYATGAQPLFALNILGFPRRLLDAGLAEEILRGGAATAREAGITVLGGHSVDDEEPKFGMCVVGMVHPDRSVRTGGAQPGDLLVLTKPLGTGIVTAALKRDAAPPDVIERAVAVMTTLNRGAAGAMLAGTVHAATDVTGFGLIGQLAAMLRAGGGGAEIDATAVPVIDGAIELADAGHVPGDTKRNMADAAAVEWHDVPETMRQLLCGAEISGGLLIAVPQAEADGLVGRLREQGAPVAAVIGRVMGQGQALSARAGPYM